ncbi:MAG: glyoxylase-like metal-dependent hydrolase (beta-lactamase superfamily II)/ferredoxin [Planctomycetota bacterium]|jgi:glyoxylase-like metal-dependent hydrolase (beta-lactamase superfamily II)/ferredoxin
MASLSKRLATNANGDFYVDSTCIDCGTCRWMAPESFDRVGEKSRIHNQPENETQTLRALKALVACPTASIGTEQPSHVKSVAAGFPDLIEDNVYHCGYHHPDSFGAASYFIVRPEGNVLVDSPRFSGPLVKRFEELGGIDLIFFTHRDDVAEHEKFAKHFGCTRVLHADDVSASTNTIEQQPGRIEPVQLANDLLMIPVPGHTRGSACLLYGEKYLFSGDHLAWSPELNHLIAFRNACWFDWETQIESMRRLALYDFEHVLPGHGAPCHLDARKMRNEMSACVEWME